MTFQPEIKNFIKNTILLTIVCALVIHFSWSYIISFFGFSAKAYNDSHFEQANVPYIGNVATALSLNLGGANGENNTQVGESFDLQVISIAEVMGNPNTGEQKLIASNMQSIKIYAGILSQNLSQLLASGSDRGKILDNHLSLLKNYEQKGQESLALIQNQKADLQAIIDDTNTQGQEAKNTLQNAYNTLTYNGVEEAINNYLTIKDTNTRAKIYMIYLGRFERSYIALQRKNKVLQNVLSQNRQAISKNVTVVIPEVGAEIVKELGLIESESDKQAKELLR